MKKVLLIGLSVFLFISLFLLLRTGRENIGDLQIKKGNSFIEDIRIVQKKKGATIWTLDASKADFTEGENKAELSDIHMMLQKNDVVLYADRGMYDFSEKSLTTKSVVKAEAKDYKITADSIDYEISSGKIQTGGRIKVEGKRFTVEGKGMKADEGQKVRVYNDVKATFQK